MDRLLTYINNSSAINCDEATVEDTLYILRTKERSDWWELKISIWKQQISWWWDFSDSSFWRPNALTKDTKKLSDIVLNGFNATRK